MYGVELVIIIVATFAQALCGNGPLADDNKQAFGLSVTTGIIIWRFILGIGVGGDYPLSAVITSEFATTNRRGAMMAAVFAMQGFGYLCTGMVAIVLLLAFRPLIEADYRNLDYVWRLLIGLGCVPALVAVYFRMTIPETPRFVLDVENNLNKAEIDVANVFKTRNALQSDRDTYADRDVNFQMMNPRKNSASGAGRSGMGSSPSHKSDRSNSTNFYGQPADRMDVTKGNFKDFVQYFGQWQNFKVLLGTSMTWFALDVAFYGIGLNNTSILSTIHFGNVSDDPWQTMWNATVGQVTFFFFWAFSQVLSCHTK